MSDFEKQMSIIANNSRYGAYAQFNELEKMMSENVRKIAEAMAVPETILIPKNEFYLNPFYWGIYCEEPLNPLLLLLNEGE